MMNTIKCDLCQTVVAYTNRTVKQATGDYLHSEKLTNEQKYQMMQRIKKIYCPRCYLKGIRQSVEGMKLKKERIDDIVRRAKQHD